MPARIQWLSLRTLPVAVIVAVAVMAAVLWLYPRQVRLLPRAWRWGLPGLRAAALLALIASLLEPVAVRSRAVQEHGLVLLLIDSSKSMGVIDNGRSVAQRVALADGLARLPKAVRPAPLAELREQLGQLGAAADAVSRARGDLSYAELSGRAVQPARARFDEATAAYVARCTSLAAGAAPAAAEALRAALKPLIESPAPDGSEASVATVHARVSAALAAAEAFQADADQRLYASDAQVRKVCDDLAGLTRLQLAEVALCRPGGLLARLEEKSPVLAFAFADRITPLPLAGPGAPNGAKEPLPGLKADGDRSDLFGAISAALSRTGAEGVRAVVLLSDGRQVGGEAARLSLPPGVPVFSVSAAGANARDVSFSRVVVPGSAFVGETVTIRAELRAAGMTAHAADVRLTTGATSIPPTAADEAQGVAEFSLKLQQAGAQQVELSIPPQPGELSAENNRARRWMKVLPEKMKVAAYAGTPGWDFQYLHSMLARTPWVQLEGGVLDPAAPALPLSAEQILRQDVLVLSDVPAAALDGPRWDAAYRLVTERGGSIVLIAGRAHLPGEYFQNVLTSNLLPFRSGLRPAWREWPGEQASFRLTPAPGAELSGPLNLADTPAASAIRWQQLPGTFRFLPLSTWDAQAKRFAELKPNSRALLAEAESGAAVLTESRLGSGRVFFLGSDETWRWRLHVGGRDHDRFWLQLVRSAAEEPYAATSGPASLDADPISSEPGGSIHVRVRLLENAGANTTRPTPQVQLLHGGDAPVSVQLSPTGPAGAGRFEATLTGLGAGDYALQLAAGPAQTQPLRVPLHVQRSDEPEIADLSGDEAPLRHIAQSSGGEFFSLDDVARLPDRMAKRGDGRPRLTERRLWDSPYLFAFVVGCLGAEWALRKIVGLA